MTTEVIMMIAGNKAVEVRTDAGPPMTIHPGQWARAYISGEQVLGIKEQGEFLPAGEVQFVPKTEVDRVKGLDALLEELQEKLRIANDRRI